jgi:hypothetical protein
VSHRISVEKSFAFGKADKGQVVRGQLASAALNRSASSKSGIYLSESEIKQIGRVGLCLRTERDAVIAS